METFGSGLTQSSGERAVWKFHGGFSISLEMHLTLPYLKKSAGDFSFPVVYSVLENHSCLLYNFPLFVTLQPYSYGGNQHKVGHKEVEGFANYLPKKIPNKLCLHLCSS